ncbi:maleylacetoacetate isomerase [Sphingomonas paucimobilis]|nr:maleylacetoacetate isomerase [Sphingomonas paucimobilis]
MAAIVACDIHPINNLRVLTRLREDMGADEAAIRRWIGHWVSEGLAALETLIAQHGDGYAYGDRPTLADCHILPQVYNAQRFAVDLSPYPLLTASAARLHALVPDAAPRSPGRCGMSEERLTSTPAGIGLGPLETIADGSARNFVIQMRAGRFHGFVVRRGEQVHGYVDRCPHMGLPLAQELDAYLTPAWATGSPVPGMAPSLRSRMVSVWAAPVRARRSPPGRLPFATA